MLGCCVWEFDAVAVGPPSLGLPVLKSNLNFSAPGAYGFEVIVRSPARSAACLAFSITSFWSPSGRTTLSQRPFFFPIFVFLLFRKIDVLIAMS